MYCSLWYMAVNKGFMLILLLDGGNSRGRRERKLLLYLVLWVCVRIIQVLIFTFVCIVCVWPSVFPQCSPLFFSATRRCHRLYAPLLSSAQPIPYPRSAPPILPSLIRLISAPSAPSPPADISYISLHQLSYAPLQEPSRIPVLQ